jgi:1-acyl-sn-glycerol-3-phosphate acyltransferase
MSVRDPAGAAPAREEAPPLRAARVGSRVAALGLTTLGTAGRLRRLAGATSDETTRERARMLRDVARRVLELHGVEVEAAGPLPLGPAILASNHVSWLDPLVVASLVPCAPVSKVDVARWPVVGTIARELGVVFVSRGDARSGARALGAAAEALARGVSVLNFPEGTTTEGKGVLPFRSGMFGLAARLGLPVVPVAIRYDPPSLAWVGDATFLPHYLTLAARRRTRAVVRLGAPEAAAPGARSAELARSVHAAVTRLLGET